jgi:hypothetical protein
MSMDKIQPEQAVKMNIAGSNRAHGLTAGNRRANRSSPGRGKLAGRGRAGVAVCLCLAVVLLSLAGCSSYEPRIKTGAKKAVVRDPQVVLNEVITACADLEKAIRSVTDAGTAKAAVDPVSKNCDQLAKLLDEQVTSMNNEAPDKKQVFMGQYQARIAPPLTTLVGALDIAEKLPGLPPEIMQPLNRSRQITKTIQDLTNVKDEAAAPMPAGEFEADSIPDSSSWAIWVLCLIILGGCVGFLFGDGLWSNALQLVNVVFAGLLTMNFYEWVANWLTKFSDDFHAYVSFFDFLAMWICFVLFASILRGITDSVSKVRVRFLKVVDQAGGVVLSLCIGWVMVCFTLTSLHAGPLAQYPLLGSFQPQNRMFFGMLAPDREWLGFTQYQSKGPFCRSVSDEELKRCAFPSDFIEKQMERRMHIEKYIRGNSDHKILVNPQLMKQPTKPAGT